MGVHWVEIGQREIVVSGTTEGRLGTTDETMHYGALGAIAPWNAFIKMRRRNWCAAFLSPVIFLSDRAIQNLRRKIRSDGMCSGWSCAGGVNDLRVRSSRRGLLKGELEALADRHRMVSVEREGGPHVHKWWRIFVMRMDIWQCTDLEP